MNRTLNIVSFLIFASALSVRAIDPVVPQIAADFAIAETTAALLERFPFDLGHHRYPACRK
ncbi:MAG: hypothetical protein WCK95_28815 [Alphaproteobacteria bacterium]